MQFNTHINNVKSIEWGLTVTEAYLFSFLYEVPSWCSDYVLDGENWKWISRDKIINELPLLNLSSRSVYRVMKGIEAKGLIVLSGERSTSKTLMRLTEKGKEWRATEKTYVKSGEGTFAKSGEAPMTNLTMNQLTNKSFNQEDHKNTLSSCDDSSPVKNDCPHDSILDSWAEIMGDKKQPNRSLWAGSTRASDLAKRWRDGFKIKRDRGQREGQVLYTTAEEGEKWWRGFFAFIRRSPFLMGETEPAAGHRTFALTLDWLLKKGNFIKVLEYNYHEDLQAPRVAQPEFRNGIK